VSDLVMPPLDDVELPTEGCWVAFRAGRAVYVLRGDAGSAWTLLSVRGTTVGTFRFARAKYRTVGGTATAPGRSDVDWREVVRALC
jgi:hypothetical protein